MATKPFKGKDDKAEELAEGRAVRAGKVSPKQYAAKEKAEGEKASKSSLMAKGQKLSSGKMSPSQYAAEAKMKSGGMVKGRKC